MKTTGAGKPRLGLGVDVLDRGNVGPSRPGGVPGQYRPFRHARHLQSHHVDDGHRVGSIDISFRLFFCFPPVACSPCHNETMLTEGHWSSFFFFAPISLRFRLGVWHIGRVTRELVMYDQDGRIVCFFLRRIRYSKPLAFFILSQPHHVDNIN